MTGFWDGLFSGGKAEEELKEYQQKILKTPKNIHLWVKIGSLLEKMGNRMKALEAYRKASEQYARDGFLIQAIAVNKVILRLDPGQIQIHDELAKLYAQRGMSEEEKLERKAGGQISQEGAEKESPLPRIPLFSDLNQGELSRIMGKMQAKRFPEGTIICEEGQPGDSIFIISQGRASVYRENVRGKRVLLNELSTGDFFGEFGFFAGSKRQATVQALEDTEVLEITKRDLEEMLQEFPGISEVLFKFYKERVLNNLLAISPVFQSFSPSERTEILKVLHRDEWSEGTLVLREGDPGDCMYIIKRGEVEVFTTDALGKERILARLKEGDFFGEIALLTGKLRTASVRTLGPAELVRLDKKDFDPLLVRHPEVGKVLENFWHIRAENKSLALGIFQGQAAKEKMI